MKYKTYEVLLFDAANTLIHKPDLWDAMLNVLSDYSFNVNKIELRRKHKLLSEIIHFPDRTSADFYKTFNYELLLSLGIVPSEEILDKIFLKCSYLPWRTFEDTMYLKDLRIKKAILSNFNSTLQEQIDKLFGESFFECVIGSEKEGVAKPSIKFYQRALEILKIEPEKVLYIGDSIKLDVIPAQALGMDAWLIDRDDNFPYFEKRIASLKDLIKP